MTNLEEISQKDITNFKIEDAELYNTVKSKELKRKVVKAYCTSDLCSLLDKGRHGYREKAFGSLKQAKKSEVFCPDCGHALFWGVSRSNSRVV